ncbi:MULTISPECIES: DUF1178 family protein [Paracoccus]|jgi:hypothetical protein|uniref:DUF1178 family protein n=1 Tax=Paracoccus denitrificans (strain Pd 1222) TaxID=318586 RepID=A1B563_PARDP|nr:MULTISPECIES: DUF1178 family protein [Paracoccus]ABL70657.1 protein of unknown function DUF1178 [Paracoccus denitrificans PD1222]MBB4627543.1 hypothetical protein [Paracoccus denitrificans]MCU7429510.1 DUF1178 family protein [Paracoccus denitrificans]QAR25985.1 DUF1178 family protein [Paracoccus denitrificans]UFS65876.1 DUF1178 family protein [Paracoccus denitrificans]
MIRYALRCDKGHEFDGWFRSSDGFESLRAAGQVTCTHCGSTTVDKALMAPRVAQGRDEAADLHSPRNEHEAVLEKLRRHVEENSDYVGMSFASEARAMHEGLAPERAIHGEAKLEDARRLLEEGIPVAPLPFRSRQRAH